MAITTVRPNGGTAADYTFTGAASVQACLNDDSDSTYIRRTSATLTKTATVQFGTTSLTASTVVKRVRLRVRCSTPNSGSRVTYTLGTKKSGINYYAATYQRKGVRSLATYEGPWLTVPPGGGSWTQDAIDALFIQVKDYAEVSADRAYTYELYADVDIVSEPTTSVTAPTGTITSTSRPEVTWTYTDTDGDLQGYYQLRVFTDAQYGAGGFNVETTTPTWDSGILSGDTTTASITQLLLNDTYRVYVRTGKAVNSSPYWGDWAYSTFTINVTAPTPPTLTLNHVVASGKVTISALGAAAVGFTSQTFEIERSSDGGTTWAQIRGGDALLPNGSGLAATADYEAPRGGSVSYRARAVGVIGSDVYVSNWGTTATITVTNDGKWWMKPINDPEISIGGLRVAPGFTEQVVEAVGVFRPYGRSSALVVTGGIQGYDGSYKIAVVGEAEWATVEPVVTHLGVVYIEDPLGNAKYIRIVARNWDFGGTVGQPLRNLTLSYVEAQA